ncbi:transcriptional regulator [Lacticaseibacillus brantae DSM 23927]|uniref:Transcriptional regulator n=1 Tax=Lacticaseibacillus brantae DSM 23927 TaxID=1423727 RepID=A0A0R2AYI2_9LACO|nr:transcriptional regulator [Lacticaseibacillus brantae DSM 23927]
MVVFLISRLTIFDKEVNFLDNITFNDRPDVNRIAETAAAAANVDPATAALYIDLQWTYLEMQKQYEAVLADYDLSESRFLIMMFLTHATDWSLTPSDIADKLGSTRATASKLIKALEQKAWVRKLTSPTDKRSSQIQLTEEGNAALERFLPHNFEVIKRMMRHLTADDFKTFTALLNKLKLGTQQTINEMEHN